MTILHILIFGGVRIFKHPVKGIRALITGTADDAVRELRCKEKRI
jgi:hypothetical protein